MMWSELDAIVDRLATKPAADGKDPGRAEGVAICISILETPYAPDLPRVRRLARERRQERQGTL
jgi:hypothetical protein